MDDWRFNLWEKKMKIECCNCDENSKEETYYKYMKKIYCASCLEDYFYDGIAETYLDRFLEEECKEIKR